MTVVQNEAAKTPCDNIREKGHHSIWKISSDNTRVSN